MGWQGGGKGGAEVRAHRVARLGSFGTSFAGDVGHTHTPAQCRWRMLPSLSLPRCCIWPPRTAASRRGHPDAALSSRFVIRVRPADAANAALPGSTCTLCTMRHDHRIRPRLLCTPAHHSHNGYTMLDIEDGDAFPHILIENECLHVTRRLIWSFCTMRRASRPGVVLCVRWLLRPPPVVLGRSSPDGPRAHRLDRCCVDINRAFVCWETFGIMPAAGAGAGGIFQTV